MARTTTIRINRDRYEQPSQEDMRLAKQYILMRDETAREAWNIASEFIMQAAAELVRIAYKYNIPPEKFSFDSSVSKPMMEEVEGVMNELDETLFLLLQERATECARNEENRLWLIALLLTLGHRNMNLRQTLHAYEWRMLHQVGALIASALYAGTTVSEAERFVRKYINNFTSSPQYTKTQPYRQLFQQPFIRNGGAPTFPDGSPNVRGVPAGGFDALRQLLSVAITHTWMKNQLLEMQQDGCAGYYQLRGSAIPCGMCDSEVGFHAGCDPEDDPFPHPNCMCYRIPVYYKESFPS